MEHTKEITLNEQQQKQVKVLEKLINHQISNKEASWQLGVTVRQVIRKKNAYLEKGMSSVVHGNKGKANSSAMPEEIETHLIELYQNEYPGWNFSHFRDTLHDDYDMTLSYTYLHNLLTSHGIKSPRKHKQAKKAHPLRPRREYAGELVQVDASNHCWITLNSKKHHLHGAIDDATGTVLSLYLDDQETSQGYRILLRDIIRDYGIPECLYTDYRNVFKSNRRLSDDEIRKGMERGDTRFATMCKRLGTDIISTMSPQAKGRIERLWNTLQDRLTKELTSHNITTKKEANEYIRRVFLPRYNARFASAIDYNRSRFVKVGSDFNYNVELALVDTRSVLSHSYVSYHGQSYRIEHNHEPIYIAGKPQIAILVLLDNNLKVRYKHNIYDLAPATRPVKTISRKTSSTAELYKLRSINSSKALANNPNHPWKQYKTKLQKVTFS